MNMHEQPSAKFNNHTKNMNEKEDVIEENFVLKLLFAATFFFLSLGVFNDSSRSIVSFVISTSKRKKVMNSTFCIVNSQPFGL